MNPSNGTCYFQSHPTHTFEVQGKGKQDPGGRGGEVKVNRVVR